VFELLADAREQVASVNAYLDALRDFWVAQTDFDLAQNGVGPNRGSARPPAAAMPAGGAAAEH
jgi:hypothetical protein